MLLSCLEGRNLMLQPLPAFSLKGGTSFCNPYLLLPAMEEPPATNLVCFSLPGIHHWFSFMHNF